LANLARELLAGRVIARAVPVTAEAAGLKPVLTLKKERELRGDTTGFLIIFGFGSKKAISTYCY
jgi:hypothetical protein